MLFRAGPGQETLLGGVHDEFYVRIELLHHGQNGGRIGRLERVDLQLRRRLGRIAPAAHALDGRTNDLLLVGAAPGDQLLRLGVDREPGVGHQGLQRGHQRGGGRRVGPEDRVGLEPGRSSIAGPAWTFSRVELIVSWSAGTASAITCAGGVERELGVRNQSLEERERALGIGFLERINLQSGRRFRGRRLAEVFDGRADDLQLRRRSPGRSAASIWGRA